MCGILGGNNKKWNYSRGIKEILHRGPDGYQIKHMSGISMAFARLSIIDLSSHAMQPMTSRDGNVTIVFNGEIYGYTELRNRLKKKYQFISYSDTEVVLQAYLEYGDKFIDKIDGMFAIAIYDHKRMQLKLFRDRAGIKPLYYYYDGYNFAFASELKALKKACTTVDFQIDYTAVYDYLFYQYIPEPKTMYKNCFKLLPAHELIFDLNCNKIKENKKYWKLHVNTSQGRYRKEQVVADELRSLLDESVKDQLIADVPVGTFLSGGIDSSIITALSNYYSPKIQTFTIGFADQRYNEVQYAKILADKYHLNCTEEIMRRHDIQVLHEKFKAWYDEPFADTSAFPSFAVAKLARKKVTVVLTGDGADELFGGYSRYQIYADSLSEKVLDHDVISKLFTRLRIKDRLPSDIREKYINTSLENYLPVIFLADKKMTESYRKKWHIEKDYDVTWHLKKYYRRELPPLTRARYLDFKTYLPGDILTKIDRVSMANSLEARVPFLSRKLIEFAYSLSESECCTSANLKMLLKKTYQDMIPDELLNRKKTGFGVPMEYLMGMNANQPITVGILKNEWKELLKGF